METLHLNGTILVVVPHSDDEIILFGGLIQRALEEDRDIFVTLVTNGDYEAATETDGIIRPRETVAGLKQLGLPDERIILLGYADTGMAKADSFLWRLWEAENTENVEPSHVGTHTYGLASHPDFHTMRHGAPAPYTQKSLREDLLELLELVKPDMVFTTHPDDAHGDHAGLYCFLREIVVPAKLFTAFCHSAQGDSAWPLPGNYFSCPPDISTAWKARAQLELTEDEMHRKGMALEVHKAALKPDAVDFLRSFIKKDEIYYPAEEKV